MEATGVDPQQQVQSLAGSEEPRQSDAERSYQEVAGDARKEQGGDRPTVEQTAATGAHEESLAAAEHASSVLAGGGDIPHAAGMGQHVETLGEFAGWMLDRSKQ